MRNLLFAGVALAVLGLTSASFAQTGGSAVGGQPNVGGQGSTVKQPSGSSGGGPVGGTGTNQMPSGTTTTIPPGNTGMSGSTTVPSNPNKTLNQQNGTSTSGTSGSTTSGSSTSE